MLFFFLFHSKTSVPWSNQTPPNISRRPLIMVGTALLTTVFPMQHKSRPPGPLPPGQPREEWCPLRNPPAKGWIARRVSHFWSCFGIRFGMWARYARRCNNWRLSGRTASRKGPVRPPQRGWGPIGPLAVSQDLDPPPVEGLVVAAHSQSCILMSWLWFLDSDSMCCTK